MHGTTAVHHGAAVPLESVPTDKPAARPAPSRGRRGGYDPRARLEQLLADPALPAIVYERVSSKYTQVGNRSAQFQEEDLPEIARAWGYENHFVINDLGKSAEQVGKRDMDRILLMCEQRAASAIVLAAFDRLTRDMRRIEGAVLWDAFTRAHLAVIVASPNRLFIPGDEWDDDYAHKEFEAASKANRARADGFGRGLAKALQAGPVHQGPVMPGWRPVLTPVVKGRRVALERALELDDAHEPGWPHPYLRVVEEIYRLAPTLGDRPLAEDLNRRGRFWHCKRWRPEVTDEGIVDYRYELVPWTNDQIKRVRTNRRYRGVFGWGERTKSERSRAVLHLAGSEQDGQLLPVVHAAAELQIVDDAAWSAASARPTAGSYPRERGRLARVVAAGGPAVGLLHPRHLAGEGLFCGLLVCHECRGKPGQGAMNYSPYTSGRRTPVRVPAYRCNTYLKRGEGDCGFSGRIKEEALFEAFLDRLGPVFAALRGNLTVVLARQAALHDERAARVAVATRQRDELVARRRAWRQATSDPTEQHPEYRAFTRAEMEAALVETKGELERLEATLAALTAPGEPHHLVALRRTLAWIDEAGTNLQAVPWSRADWKQLIATFFARIEYTFEDKVVGLTPEGLVLRDALAVPAGVTGAKAQSSTEDLSFAPVVALATRLAPAAVA